MSQTDRADWDMWRERCALDLCSHAARDRLTAFAASRMEYFVRRYVHHTNIPKDDARLCVPQARECWHRFEAHAAMTSSRRGKRYKEWIFSRQRRRAADGGALGAIESGATLILRDVARTLLHEEFSPRGTVSADKKAWPGTNSPTFADLLPGDPMAAHGVEIGEYQRLANQMAQTFMDAMSRREKIALLAKFEGLSLACPGLEKIAGCSKSTLNNVVHDLMRRIAGQVRETFREDGQDSVYALSILTLRELEKILFQWKKLEKKLLRFFNSVEER